MRHRFGQAVFVAGIVLAILPLAIAEPRLIELTADRDSRYRIAGQRLAEITVKAGE